MAPSSTGAHDTSFPPQPYSAARATHAAPAPTWTRPFDNGRPCKYTTTMAQPKKKPKRKRKTARLRASMKRKARKKQERKSGHKRVKGGA